MHINLLFLFRYFSLHLPFSQDFLDHMCLFPILPSFAALTLFKNNHKLCKKYFTSITKPITWIYPHFQYKLLCCVTFLVLFSFWLAISIHFLAALLNIPSATVALILSTKNPCNRRASNQESTWYRQDCISWNDLLLPLIACYSIWLLLPSTHRIATQDV